MKETILSIIVAGALIGGAILMSGGNQEKGTEVSVNNVTVVDGKQIIEITAKGGYLPEKSVASAGIPTVLRINTKGTFDCSSSVRVPSMNISQNLPPSGVTDIDLGTLSKGIIDGTCSMGMYPFEIEVKG
jgi:plastocyanin domain-containing protein